MAQGFTRLNVMGGIARDSQATTPPGYETSLGVAARTGVVVTASATIHTVGNYVQLIASSAAVTYGIWLRVSGVAVGATDTSQLLNLATGGAGAETNIINNINCGQASNRGSGGTTNISGGKEFYFGGLNIPASTRFACNLQGKITVDTAEVSIFLESRAQWHVANSTWVTYGADTANSRGTSVPTGSGAFGAWTSIATTSRQHYLLAIAYDLLSATVETDTTDLVIEMGYGPNSGSITSIGLFDAHSSSGEAASSVFPLHTAFNLPTSSQIWLRVAGPNTNNRGFIIYGN